MHWAIYLLAIPAFLSIHTIEHHMHEDEMHEEHSHADHESEQEIEHDCDLYLFYTTAKHTSETLITDSFMRISQLSLFTSYKPIVLELTDSFHLRGPPTA